VRVPEIFRRALRAIIPMEGRHPSESWDPLLPLLVHWSNGQSFSQLPGSLFFAGQRK